MTRYCCVTRCRVTSASGARLFQIPKIHEQPLTRNRWLKKLNVTGNVPELLFLCEKHITMIEEDEHDSNSNLPWNSPPVKIENEGVKEDNNDEDLKTCMIYPNKTEQGEPTETSEVYEILANLQSTETSSRNNIITNNLKPPKVEFPINHCGKIFINPFLDPNTTIDLESSENETVEINNTQCFKIVPLQNFPKEKKDGIPLAKVNPKKKTERLKAKNKKLKKNVQKVVNKFILPKPPIVTINVDSSDDETQERKQTEHFTSTTKEECKSSLDVLQKNRQDERSEVLVLKENLRMARKRVSEVSQELHRLERSLKKTFNSDQIRHLKDGSRKCFKWKAKTLKKALELFFTCGESGYKCLLNQNYPLPSVHSLQRVIFDYKISSDVLAKARPVQRAHIRNVQDIIDKLVTKQLQKT